MALRTALGVLGNREAAEDVAQEVAIIALRRSAQLRDIDKLDAWLHRVAVRAALKEARGRAKRRSVELPDCDAEAAASAPTHAGVERASALLSDLPPRQRAAMVLRYVHDLTDEEIAGALNCREGTVRSLLSRGRTGLRTALEDNPEPQEER